MEWPVTYRRKIRFSDSDAQGVVFNGNYLTYFDDTVTDWMDAIGVGWDDLTRSGHDMVLARCEIEFKSPGRIGDVLVTGVRVEGVGRSSLRLALSTWNEVTGRVVVLGRQVQVIVDHETFSPRPVPDFLVEAIERLQGPLSDQGADQPRGDGVPS